MPLDLSAWELSRMLIALLVGIVLVALPAAVLLVRARRRESRLRRQVARLTTSQALLSGPNRSGTVRRNEADDPMPDIPVQASPPQHSRDAAPAENPGAAYGWAGAEPYGPAQPEPGPIPAGMVAEVPASHSPGGAPPTGQAAQPAAPPGSAFSVPAHGHPDPPTQPEAGAGFVRQPQPNAAPGGQDPSWNLSMFATEESAERFRRDYADPMEEHRRRLAELRSQLSDITIDQGTNSAQKG